MSGMTRTETSADGPSWLSHNVMMGRRIRTLVLMLLASAAACSDLPRARSVSLLASSQASREVELEGKSRTALDGLRWVSLLKVPQNAVLQFSMAVLGTPSAGLPATEFLIEIEVDGKQSRAFRETLAAYGGNRWNDRLVDLTPWEGRAVSLIFTARPVLDASGVVHRQSLVPVWGDPVLASVPANARLGQSVELFNDWHRRPGRTHSVGDTKFSHDRGFYETPFEVILTTATPDATIVYTTDGSKPSVSHGIVGNKVLVEKTTVLRVMAYKPGARSTNVDTHTYIFPDTVKEQATLPFDYPAPFRSFNVVPYADLDVGIDPDVVNTSNEREFVEGLTSIPTLSIVMDVDHLFNESQGLYFGKGPLTHPASVELLYPSKFSHFKGFQVDCGIREHGQYLYREKRSFRLVFRKDFGPGMLRYSFFESAVHHAESAVKEFNSLVLRAGGQENWSRKGGISELAVYVRDQHARDSQLSLSGTAAHGIFVHLYLNGIYWGVYNAVERPERRFLASYYGGDPADWFAINHSGVVGKPNHPRWYITMYRYAREHDLSEPAKYREMKTLLNTAQFSDYILLNWFSGTGDWGKMNWYGGIRIHPPGPGLYFCWDSEITYGLFAKYGNAGAWVPPEFVSGGTSALHQLWMALADSPEFRLEFADRVYRACYDGGPLTDSVNKANFRRLADYVESAMLCESARWGDASPGRENRPRTRDVHWKRSRDYVLDLMDGNVERFLRALRDHDYYPTLDPPVFERASDSITIRRPAGAEKVYYTLDGSDPRNPTAHSFSEAVSRIPFSPNLKGRSRRGDEWSALNEYGTWERD